MRLLAFVSNGQCSHDYGLDFAQRLPAGLVVEPIRFFDVLRPAEREQLGIRTDELLFLCRKPA